MIDPKDYAEIVAKRPELAVTHPLYPSMELRQDIPCWSWKCTITGTTSHISFHDPEACELIAEALIGWHWTRMLPPTCCLRHNLDDPPRWTCGNVCNEHGQASGLDPLSALTEFWRSQ